jgi:FkbM family methyltransferase
MNLGNRGRRAVLLAPFRGAHYRALLGMVARYPDLRDSARRYLTGRGEYPHQIRIRTPIGVVRPTLFSSHDISTVNEVFCRGVYRTGDSLGVVVDIGANIGVSALYFLAENPAARAYLFEPVPRNVERLRLNLSGFEHRYRLEEAAVSLQDGEATFATEASGRYGTLRVEKPSQWERTQITVRTREINSVLRDVLEREQRIDLLKIDTEGTEPELVAAIRPELLARIASIVYESDEPAPLHRDRYRHRYRSQINRLTAIPSA